MTPELQVIEGSKAERLLADETLSKAFTDVENAIVERWKAAPLRDKDGAHELRVMVKLLGDVRACLEMAVQNGKLAAEELRLSKEKPARWWAINRG
jgi:hypothetical protein